MVRSWCVLYILTWKCASRHNGVQFFIAPLASWLRTRRFSEPTFRPSRATNHWKNTVFRDFPTFSRICIFCLLTLSLLIFSLLIFLFSLPLPCFSSLHIVGSLTSKLPLTIEKFEAKAVRLYSFSATPGKQCLPPKVSLGGLRDRTVEYTTWVKRITVFAQSFHYNREVWGQSCSAILIFRNPRKAMFAPKSASRRVAGSYCWVYYMGKRNYSICSIFPLQQRFSRPKLVSCTHFPQPPESNVCSQKCL